MIHSLITIHCAINVHKHSLQQDLPHPPLPNIIPPNSPCIKEASSTVLHACLLEGGFRIMVQCIKNKNKSKLKLGGIRGNRAKGKYLFIKASLQLLRFPLHPQRPASSAAYFHVTLLPASPQGRPEP